MSRSLALAVLLMGCSHSRQAAQPPLPDALVLEWNVDKTVITNRTPIRASFRLRNVANVTVEFCQLDGGVSIWDKSGDGMVRPIKLRGLVLDASCNERTRLPPGESKTFEDSFKVWPDQLGPVDVFASIRVSVPRDVRGPESSDPSIRAQPIRLTVRSAV
jgi:hypothetical protein